MQVNTNTNCWGHMFVCIWSKADRSILDTLRKLILGSISFSFSRKSLVACCSFFFLIIGLCEIWFFNENKYIICLCSSFVTAVISWSIISQQTSCYPCFYNFSVSLTQWSLSFRSMSWAVPLGLTLHDLFIVSRYGFLW